MIVDALGKVERLFIIYSTVDKSLEKNCHDRNYEILEQILDMESGEHFTIELRDMRINKKGIIKTRKLTGKSKALTFFFNDLKNKEENQLKSFFTNYINDLIASGAVEEYLDEEEKAYGIERDEAWIEACNLFVQTMGYYNGKLKYNDDMVLEAYNRYHYSVRFEVPRELVKQTLNEIDFGLLTSYAAGNSLYLSDLGSTILFDYFFAPFYYYLATRVEDPDDNAVREITKYNFGLG